MCEEGECCPEWLRGARERAARMAARYRPLVTVLSISYSAAPIRCVVCVCLVCGPGAWCCWWISSRERRCRYSVAPVGTIKSAYDTSLNTQVTSAIRPVSASPKVSRLSVSIRTIHVSQHRHTFPFRSHRHAHRVSCGSASAPCQPSPRSSSHRQSLCTHERGLASLGRALSPHSSHTPQPVRHPRGLITHTHHHACPRPITASNSMHTASPPTPFPPPPDHPHHRHTDHAELHPHGPSCAPLSHLTQPKRGCAPLSHLTQPKRGCAPLSHLTQPKRGCAPWKPPSRASPPHARAPWPRARRRQHSPPSGPSRATCTRQSSTQTPCYPSCPWAGG